MLGDNDHSVRPRASQRGQPDDTGKSVAYLQQYAFNLPAPEIGDNAAMNTPNALRHYAWLSIATALTTMALKALAWWLTGSVGLLSDALESGVNLAGAMMALAMLTLAARPADRNHAFGHGKAEYFASAFEGMLILGAALGIAYAAIDRLLSPQALVHPGWGLAISSIASVANFLVARRLIAAGQQQRSITLEADGAHLMADVWTSIGVMVGVAAAALTGWAWLDPVIALAVAGHILIAGWSLMLRSADGLMDASIPAQELAVIEQILQSYRTAEIDFHNLRTRRAGSHDFISLHVLVPGSWSVQQGHDLLEDIEGNIRSALPHTSVFTHLEPLEDPSAYDEIELDH